MPYSPDPHAAQFFATDVCAATGVSPANLKNWISRDPPAIILTAEDRAAGTSGRPNLFTFNRVMQVALTAELVKFGMTPRRAGILAATFTDTADGLDANGKHREPGELFSDGHTVLVAYESEEWATILNMGDGTLMRDIFFPRDSSTPRVSACAVVWVNVIDARVRATLNAG